MANNDGRRAIINDPLAPNARERSPDRSLQGSAVHAPSIPSAQSLTVDSGVANALQGIEGILAQELDKKKDEWITEGKVAYQSGVTEHQILETGNAFTAQGYRGLQARDRVNTWFTEQTIALDTTGKQTSPSVYAEQLKQQRSDALKGITDPNARKVASAAFEEMSPRLAASQAVKHNEFNRGENIKAFSSVLSSTGRTSATASKLNPDNPLAVSPVPVGPVMQPSARDRDIGIRTMLGEAGNQGADGLAAVAHVLRNRSTDARWPDSIAGVALQPKQFSTWNKGAGGNSIPHTVKPGSAAYERAGQVFDTVMGGKHVDPTGSATHYFSAPGMGKLVAEGSQTNLMPRWWAEETKRSGGSVKIGVHQFAGRSSGATPRAGAEAVTALSLAAGTTGDLNATQPGAVTGVAQAGGVNEVQQIIYGIGIPNEDKATGLSDAMRRTLEAGDESLFRDAGGVAMLHRLGAKPNEIDEVLKARKRFEDKKQTEFSTESIKFNDSIMQRAEAGESLDTILADVEKRHKDGLLNDNNARQIATTAADKIRAQAGESKSKMTDPDMLTELGGLYQNVATGLPIGEATKQGKAIASKFGATEKDVQQIVGTMMRDSQSYQNKLRADATTAAKSKAEQDISKAEVDRALASGRGLGILNGSAIKVAEGKTISQVEYGINAVKDKWAKFYTDGVNAGTIDPSTAKRGLEQKVALELQNHGVVDQKWSAEVAGSLSGNIVDAKTGGLKPAALEAYDSWLALKEAPGITPAYLSKMVPDETARNLLEHAFLFDSGTLNKGNALVKAHEVLNDPNRDPNDKINRDVVWKQKMDVDLKKTLLARTHPGFMNSLFRTKDANERERILTNNKTAENYVNMRADAYHLQNPNEHGEVSLEKALQDLQAHSTPVMGNLIITRPGKELPKMMGVETFGPTAADDAISSYIRANGARIWGKFYTEREPSNIIGNSLLGHLGAIDQATSNIPGAISANYENPSQYTGTSPDAPPVHVTYNAEMGTITVDLYKDKDRKTTLGNPKHFSVKSIGALYAKEQNTPTSWDKAWAGAFTGAVAPIKAAAASYTKEVQEAFPPR